MPGRSAKRIEMILLCLSVLPKTQSLTQAQPVQLPSVSKILPRNRHRLQEFKQGVNGPHRGQIQVDSRDDEVTVGCVQTNVEEV